MKTALLVIATGPRYLEYARNLIKSASEFFVPHDVILFTDESTEIRTTGVINYHSEYTGFPQSTLMRYHLFNGAANDILRYDQVFYVDADMKFVAPVGEEIFSESITATEHPGYVGLNGTPEKRPESTAYCPIVRNYFCGGFNGGEAGAFLRMAKVIADNIDRDTERGITAVWHDESHLNRYLYDNPPARILSPSFCYPESEYKKQGYYNAIWQAHGRKDITPKLLALDKPR